MITANTFSNKELEELADLILEGGTVQSQMRTETSLNFIDKTYEELVIGIEEIEDQAPYLVNLRQFSIAKQATILQEFNGLKITDPDLRDEFIGKLDTLHNVHLATEKRTATAQAQTVNNWKDVEANKSVAPFLEYLTADDSKVRPEHAELDGIVRRVDDPFWSTYLPPLSYNCRCDWNQIIEPSDSIVGRKNQSFDKKEANKGVAPGLANNPARSKEIFSNEHPYFQ